MLGRELVDKRRWLSVEKFDLAFALARVTPGTNSIAFCAAVGSVLRGWRGAIAAVLASTAPCAIVAVVFISVFEASQDNRIAMAGIGGTVAAVVGMMWSTIWTILRPHVGSISQTLRVLLIAGGAFAASWGFNVSPLPIILLGGITGLLWTDEAA